MSLPEKQFLKKWLGISLGVHLLGAIFSEGFHHYDEHFCIVEWTKYLLGEIPSSVLNEDFQLQMRPLFPPMVLTGISKLLYGFGIRSPFTHAFFFRLVSSLLGFFSQSLLMAVGLKEIIDTKLRQSFILFTSVFFLLPYLHNHPSSESWGTSFFVLGVALFFLKPRSFFRDFTIGILFCFSFQGRYQMGIMIAGFALWQLVVIRVPFRTLLLLVFGFAAGALLCGYLDFIGYKTWTLPAWNYFRWQVLEGGAARNGVDPLWYYFPKIIILGAFPISLLILAAFIYFWGKFYRHYATWITFPFFAAHLILGHKEERYLFPMLPFVPFVLMFSFEQFRFRSPVLKKIVIRLFKVGFVVNLILLAVANLRCLRNEIDLYKKMYTLSGTVYFEDQNPYDMASVGGYFYRSPHLSVLPIASDEAFLGQLQEGKALYLYKKVPVLIPELSSHCQINFSFELRFLPDSLKKKMHRLAHLSTWTLFECKL